MEMPETADGGRRMKEEVRQQGSGSPKWPDSEPLLCGRECLSISPTDKERFSEV